MRDPRRIGRILALLQQIWEYQPDVRFNQLISNLQSLYSQQNDNYGRREVYKKEFINVERTSYLDFFFLEDDMWEGFLTSYLSSIEESIERSREKIADKTINEDICPSIDEVSIINLFSIISEDFFKPLTSKYKATYIDCLRLIYNTYKTELSFGVDKEVILAKLESYFEDLSSEDMIFEDDEEFVKDSRAKANAILRNLKDSGWIKYDVSNDYKVKVNLFDHAVTIIESFNKIIKNEEMKSGVSNTCYPIK